LLLTPSTASRRVVATIPPKAFNSSPIAWDAVPRAAAGQVWTLTARVKLPQPLFGTSQTAYVQAVAFTHPNGLSKTLLSPRVKVSGQAGVWQSVTIPNVVAPVDSWLGAVVTVDPTGPRWDDVPSATSWDSLTATAWDDVGPVFVDDVDVLAPAAGALRQGAVFGGRVTDLQSEYDVDLGATLVSVIAQNNLAELANRYVGDTPWPAQTVAARVAGIVAAADQPRLTATVDPGVRNRQLCYLDVDAQPAAQLLADVAQSVGGVLWAPTSVAAQTALRIEDIDARPPLLRLGSTVPVVTNLFTRPSFEDNLTTGFTGTNGTLTTLTTGTGPVMPTSGVRYLRITAASTAAPQIGLTTATLVPVVVGKRYRWSVYSRSGIASPTGYGRIIVDFRDAAGARIAGTDSASPSIPYVGTSWERKTKTTGVAPAGAVTTSAIFVVDGGTRVAGQTFDWDAIMVEELPDDGSAPPMVDYFDGDTPNTATDFYAWTGAQWSSTSAHSGVLTVTPAATAAGIELDACLVLLDPVRWDQDSTDTATQVAVGWQEQTAAGPPPTLTARDVTRTDDALTATRGRFRVSISTDLATLTDATNLADTMLARLSVGGWRVTGLTWQIDAADVLDGPALSRVMTVLDGTTRIGLPILLTGLPAWSPISPEDTVALYLEGGRFSNTRGAWRLELDTSSAVAQGKAAMSWDQQPAYWTWDQYAPSVSWDSLAGVAPIAT
jgi:hypothetical protein